MYRTYLKTVFFSINYLKKNYLKLLLIFLDTLILLKCKKNCKKIFFMIIIINDLI